MHRSARLLARRAVHETVEPRICSQRRSMSLALPYHLYSDSQKGNSSSSGTSNINKIQPPALMPKRTTSRPSLSLTYFESSRASNLPPKGRPDQVVQRLRAAIQDRNVSELHVTYNELRSEAMRSLEPSHAGSHLQAQELSSLTVEDLRDAMLLALGPPIAYGPDSKKAKISQSRQSNIRMASIEDGKLVQQIFSDLKDVFRFPIDSFACQMSLESLAVQKVNPMSIFQHLMFLKKNFKQYFIDERSLLVVLGECDNRRDADTARKVWEYLTGKGIKVESLAQDLMISVFLKVGNFDMAKTIAFGHQASLESIKDVLSTSTTFDQASFLEGLCRAGDGLSIHSTLLAEALRKRLYETDPSPSLPEWHALLLHTGFTRGSRLALSVIRDGIKAGIKPDGETFNLLLQCHANELSAIAANGTEEDVRLLFKRIQGVCNVSPDIVSFSVGINSLLGNVSSSILYSGEQSAAHLRETLQEAFPDVKSVSSVHVKIALGSEVEIAETLSLGFESELKSSTKGNDALERVPRFTPGQVHEATLLYEHCLSLGFQPDESILNPLIIAHAYAYVPSMEKIGKLYRDLRKMLDGRKEMVEESEQENVGIGRETYRLLLYACSKSRDMAMADRFLQDMIRDGISLRKSTQSNLAIMMMQVSESHQAAFRIYTRFLELGKAMNSRNDDNKARFVQITSPFTYLGWTQIIDCFSRLEISQNLPPVEYMLEMIRNMQSFKFQSKTTLFTTMLRYYGRIALYRKEKDQFRSAVVQIHMFLQIQEDFEPDLVLVTALMDAYNRVDLPNQALEVWNRLTMNDTHTDSSCIAVLLDTCGRAGRLREARRAWEWVRRQTDRRKECNKGVWDAYVECLSRCGRVEEAVEVAFGEMRTELNSRGDIGPDAKTMGMLLRFASASTQRWTLGHEKQFPLLSALKRRLCEEMPEIWDQVKVIHIPVER